MGPTSSPSTLVWEPDDLLATVSNLVHKLQYLYLVWHISVDHSYSTARLEGGRGGGGEDATGKKVEVAG